MLTSKELDKGLEWISGKTRIIINCHDKYLDLILYPNYPVEKTRIVLYLIIDVYRNEINICDFFDPKFNIKYQKRGFGT